MSDEETSTQPGGVQDGRGDNAEEAIEVAPRTSATRRDNRNTPTVGSAQGGSRLPSFLRNGGEHARTSRHENIL